jgi:hypothetical protein
LARALLAASAALIELFVVLCAALIGETFYHGFAHGWSGLIPPNMRLCSLVALLFVLSNASRGDYRIPDFLASHVNGWRLFTVWSASFLIALAFSFLTKSTGEFSRAGVVLFYVAGYVAIYVTRLALRHVARGATVAGGRRLSAGAPCRLRGEHQDVHSTLSALGQRHERRCRHRLARRSRIHRRRSRLGRRDGANAAAGRRIHSGSLVANGRN